MALVFASNHRLARIAFLALATSAMVPAARADDPGCKEVSEATIKTTLTPRHMYETSEEEGKKAENEMICTADSVYIQVEGNWKKIRSSPKAMVEREQANIRNAKNYHCEHERDDTVNGEAVTVYKVHSETEANKTDTELSISKSRGLILRQTVDFAGENRRTSSRYDYVDVNAPDTK